MGIVERKQREKQERKALILNKAKELILERGIPALNMQDIADAVELSKATLYLYFQSKEAILNEILEDAADKFADCAGASIGPDDSGLEAMRKLWESHLRMFGESSDLFFLVGISNYIRPVFALERPDSESEGKHPMRSIHRLIADVLRRGVADGTLDPSLNPDKIARTVLIIGMGITESVARLPRDERDVRLIFDEMRSTFGILLRGLAAKGTDPAQLSMSLQ